MSYCNLEYTIDHDEKDRYVAICIHALRDMVKSFIPERFELFNYVIDNMSPFVRFSIEIGDGMYSCAHVYHENGIDEIVKRINPKLWNKVKDIKNHCRRWTVYDAVYDFDNVPEGMNDFIFDMMSILYGFSIPALYANKPSVIKFTQGKMYADDHFVTDIKESDGTFYLAPRNPRIDKDVQKRLVDDLTEKWFEIIIAICQKKFEFFN